MQIINQNITQDFVKLIAMELPYGAVKEVAEKVGVTKTYVSYILNGHRNANTKKGKQVINVARSIIISKYQSNIKREQEKIRVIFYGNDMGDVVRGARMCA